MWKTMHANSQGLVAQADEYFIEMLKRLTHERFQRVKT